MRRLDTGAARARSLKDRRAECRGGEWLLRLRLRLMKVPSSNRHLIPRRTRCEARRTSLPDFKYDAASVRLVKTGDPETPLCLIPRGTLASGRMASAYVSPRLCGGPSGLSKLYAIGMCARKGLSR